MSRNIKSPAEGQGQVPAPDVDNLNEQFAIPAVIPAPEHRDDKPVEEEATETAELVPPVSPEVLAPPQVDEPKKSRLWLKIGAPIAAIAAFGGSFLVAHNSGGDDHMRNDVAVLTTPTTAQEYTPTTLNPLAEQLGNEYAEPKPATTNDPQEILDALFYNLDGYLNTGNEDCLKFYVFNPDDVNSSLIQVLQKQRDSIEEYQRTVVIYRQVDKPLVNGEPDYSDPNSPTIPVKVSAKAGNDTVNYSGTLKLSQTTREFNGQTFRVWTVIDQNFTAPSN
ncbi:MAG TPA: hypothetical protein VLG25_02225 [Patescibacteria group bacterium]|nr:hypothetical protein [Patescibacteria group bacterium]